MKGPKMTVTPPNAGSVSPPVRLLLVDAHERSRRNARALLDAVPTVQVVGDTGNHRETLDLAQSCAPDVVVIAIRVSGASGPEVTRGLLSLHPKLRVVFFTLFDSPEYVNAAVGAGAHGYVLKEAPTAELLATIDAVMRGQTMLRPDSGPSDPEVQT